MVKNIIYSLFFFLCFSCSSRFTLNHDAPKQKISPVTLREFVPSAVTGLPEACRVMLKTEQDNMMMASREFDYYGKKWVRWYIQDDVIDYVYLGRGKHKNESILLLRYSGGTYTQVIVANIKVCAKKLILQGYQPLSNIRDTEVSVPSRGKLKIGDAAGDIDTLLIPCKTK